MSNEDRSRQAAGGPPPELMGGEPPSGYQELLGYRVARWEEGRAELELSVLPHHLNRAGLVHGGVLMSLLDTAMGFSACWCPMPGRVRRAVTLSLSSSFLGSARSGNLVAIGRLRGGGRKIVSVSGEVIQRDTGLVLAAGEGMFKYMKGSESPDGVEP
ncbi:PaaI family thioesterase [Azospirillum sp. SYSU D00513]|uniref:PaaI family thioesterase n=1 Tax=Azospirillum sp. SYSU D00513 TaxID=2812561 RepID=UPI001A95F9EB|nr:PaaI family thioesterase [Azospirillum sp. SYSU D00513]